MVMPVLPAMYSAVAARMPPSRKPVTRGAHRQLRHVAAVDVLQPPRVLLLARPGADLLVGQLLDRHGASPGLRCGILASRPAQMEKGPVARPLGVPRESRSAPHGRAAGRSCRSSRCSSFGGAIRSSGPSATRVLRRRGRLVARCSGIVHRRARVRLHRRGDVRAGHAVHVDAGVGAGTRGARTCWSRR